MSQKNLRLLLLSAILFMGSQALWAQSGGIYEIGRSTIDGGGGRSDGANFTVEGTIGQPDAGVHAGGNFTVSGGFWTGAPCSAPPAVSLTPAGGQVTFGWQAGVYNIFRAVDDPYFTAGTQIGTNENSNWVYGEPLLGDPAQNAYYKIGSAAGCGKHIGEFDFALTPGS